jgi:uncharacterized protein (TIGR04255 family)
MFERLPAPDERPLARAPIQIVTFRLDFAEERALKPLDALGWQEQLRQRGHETPRLAAIKQQTLNVSIGSRKAEQTVSGERTGWQVFFEDGASNAALFSTGVAVEHFNYDGYDHLRRDALDAYDSAVALLAPQVQHRVTLSYSNALSEEAATSAEYWRGKVRPEFLGVVQQPALAEGFLRSLSMVSWTESEYSADLQLAIQPDEVFTDCKAFIFQAEVARKGIVPLSRDELERSIDRLHLIALKLFAAVLEPRHLETLRHDETTNAI